MAILHYNAKFWVCHKIQPRWVWTLITINGRDTTIDPFDKLTTRPWQCSATLNWNLKNLSFLKDWIIINHIANKIFEVIFSHFYQVVSLIKKISWQHLNKKVFFAKNIVNFSQTFGTNSHHETTEVLDASLFNAKVTFEVLLIELKRELDLLLICPCSALQTWIQRIVTEWFMDFSLSKLHYAAIHLDKDFKSLQK